MNCLKISVDNVVSNYEAKDLKDLQRAVGGDVEYISLHYCNMVINENRFKCVHFNSLASIILAVMLNNMNPVKGDVLIVGPVDAKGITLPFNDNLRELFFDHFPVLKGRYIA
jgi:hypothetical protein